MLLRKFRHNKLWGFPQIAKVFRLAKFPSVHESSLVYSRATNTTLETGI